MLIEQKVLITGSQIEINNLIARGWKVASIIPQVVSTNNSYSPMRGEFCILFEREILLTKKSD